MNKKLILYRLKYTIIILFIILFTILFSFTCYAKLYRIKFMWNANNESDLAGYKLYSSTESLQYDANSIIYTITPGTITEYDYTTDIITKTYWVITAYDNQLNESDYSNEVYFDPDLEAPNKPNNFQLFFVYPISDRSKGNITTIINNVINNNTGN